MRKALLLAKTIRHTKWYAMGPNQRTLLQKWTDALQERADTPVAENTHYTRCVWSYPFCECGPDTCYCSRTTFIIKHLEELSTELQNIPVRLGTTPTPIPKQENCMIYKSSETGCDCRKRDHKSDGYHTE